MQAKIWNLRHCRLKSTLVGHVSAIFSVDFDQESGVVFTGSADKVRNNITPIYTYLKLIEAANKTRNHVNLSKKLGEFLQSIPKITLEAEMLSRE